MNKFFDYTDEVEFRSKSSIEDCVRNLKSAAIDSVSIKAFFAPMNDTGSPLAGRVNEKRVILHRIHFMMRNSFQAYFYGNFSRVGSETILKGRFTMARPVKIFDFIFFTFAILFTVITLFASASDIEGSRALLILIPLGISGFAVLLTLFGKWISKGDVQWISDKIKSAIA